MEGFVVCRQARVSKCGFKLVAPSTRPTMLRGYVVGDFDICINEPSNRLYIKVKRPARVEHIVGVYGKMLIVDRVSKRPFYPPFIPNQRHVANHVASVIHRFGCKMPRYNGDVFKDFNEFSRLLIRSFSPVTPHELPDFEDWLLRTSYNGSRKSQLRALKYSKPGMDYSLSKSKSFIKWEGYCDAKHPRAINSPSDESKICLGPLINAIDKKTFKAKWFVKGSDPREWPKRLLSVLGTDPVMETDFSSMESHHRDGFAKLIFYWFMHMSRTAMVRNSSRRLVAKLMLGTNSTEFRTLTAMIPQRLMSGAMWTSSANGVLNLCLLSYLIMRSRFPHLEPSQLIQLHGREFRGFVEGDDGLCAASDVNMDLITGLGLKLKFKFSSNYTEASFCGIVTSGCDGTLVTDPLKVLRNFFVIPPKYKMASDATHRQLFRAKALSYKYLYNDCPVVGPLCDKVCELTKSVDCRKVMSETNPWLLTCVDQSQVLSSWKTKPNVTDGSREIVARHFKFPLLDQLAIEKVIGLSLDGVFEINYSLPMSRDRVEHMLKNLVWRDSGGTSTSTEMVENVISNGLGTRPIANDSDRRYVGATYYPL